jgi:hypothetical protein
MAWSYLVICVFDFIIGPIMNAIIAYMTDTTYHEWNPLTLRGGGLYHMAMAAIVGLATWSRGTEKQIVLNARENEDNTDTTNTDDQSTMRRRDATDDQEADDNDSRHKGDDA